MKIRAFAALAAVAALALSGCAGGGDTGDGDTAENPTIRIVGIGIPDFSAVDVAKWQENLKADGFNVDFKSVEEEDAALRAVVADAADVYIGSLPSAITAVQNTQAPVKLIAINAEATDYVVLAENSIKTIDDLAGTQIGVNTPGSAGDTIMKLALEAEGFDVDSAEYVVIGGSGARVAALQAGQIKATVAHLAAAEAAIQTGGFHALVYCGPALGSYIQTGLIASQSFIDKDPAVTQRVVNALIDAERWSATEKDEYIELSQTVDTETDDAVRDSAYDQFVDIGFFAVNGGLDEDGLIDNWIDVSLKSGDIDANYPDKSEWIDDSFVKAYVEKNGAV